MMKIIPRPARNEYNTSRSFYSDDAAKAFAEGVQYASKNTITIVDIIRRIKNNTPNGAKWYVFMFDKTMPEKQIKKITNDA